MTEFEFRITLVPNKDLNSLQKDHLLLQVKSYVEKYIVTCDSIQYFQVKKSEDEDDPEIEELTLEVGARIRSDHHTSKLQQYEEFCLRWRDYFDFLPPSYIQFYCSDSFVKCKHSHHKLAYHSIEFGVLPHNGKFYQFADLKNCDKISNSVIFYHDMGKVLVEFDTFEISFSYENIRNIFVNIEENPSKIYLDLFNPPVIFRTEFKKHYNKRRNLNMGLSGLSPKIDADVLGRSNVLCLTVEDSGKVREIVARIHHQCSEKPVYYSCITVVPQVTPPDPVIETIDFSCTYLITALFRRNFVLISQTSDIHNSLMRIGVLSQQNSESLEKALTAVLSALDSGKILNFWNAIENQYIYYTSKKDEIDFQDYIFPSRYSIIRRITLTPTRQLLWPKEIMLSNRILRKFDAEYSIRVNFRDDNMSKLSFSALYSDSGVFESCIKNPMTDGICIGPRKYEFLAWSNSQIRDHGVWMYARDTEDQTAVKIREWMGDFSHIRNVPKYMARMGQCFSQTEDALSVPLDSGQVRIEDDIEGGWDRINNRPYCFTDGVGRISENLASQVHKALDHDKLCSAFQIRYGGCKGMLVVDPTLKDADIVFRNSMKKFNCPNSTRLEIAKTSGPVPLYLNRQIITLLDGLGVEHRMFLRRQENTLKMLTDMLFIESDASDFLESKIPKRMYNFKNLSKSGIQLTAEPFFKALLLALHRHYTEKIKLKANIAIDPREGRNMLGVVDETNTLNYGEVFVQYTKDICYGETTRDTVVHKGEVLVTKNPCLHPGDVRKFTAVDAPSLHHIVDCIVFPQRGHRPHPNEMAGSDLDGDEYSVLWDPDLIFYGDNKEPADFPAAQIPDIPDGTHITVSDMINFLQNYIKSDNVGIIANAHLVQADRLGIEDPICQAELFANKFSIVIDFPKTGKSECLTVKERPEEYPDFMEDAYHDRYKSRKANGKIYRLCKDFELENQEISLTYKDIKVDPDLVFNGWEKYQENAINARNKYNALFMSVLRNYGIEHEAEIFSGAFANLHCRFEERKDGDEVEKMIVDCIKKLYKCMRQEFMEEFSKGGDSETIVNGMLQKASAWYYVTYSDPNANILSFPWAVSKYLALIKIRHTLANPPPFSPAIMNLDQKIAECESKLPECPESSIWNHYQYLCDPLILKRALRTLILWAIEQGIIKRPGYTQRPLSTDVFVKLFFHVSEELGYVTKELGDVEQSKKQYSAGQLCLDFLKFCSVFRFYIPCEMDNLLPFTVKMYSRLAKCAIFWYHKFALSDTFDTLNFEEAAEKKSIVMKPIYINSKIFPESRTSAPINRSSLQRMEEALMKYSEVDELNLREVREAKNVCVCAKGSDEALKKLKSILRKKDATLRRLFITGVMPE